MTAPPPHTPPPAGHEPSAWRLHSDTPSLQEVHNTIPVPPGLSFWRKLLAFSGPGISRRRRLHGSRQLGHRPRRRLGVRLHAAQRHPALEPDGDPAPVALREAGHRHRTRSRAGLPRSLFATGVVRALDPLRSGDLRVRPRGGHRLGHRAESAVRPAARLGRVHHRARRAGGDVSAEQGIPLHRGAGHHADRHDRRLLLRRDHLLAARHRRPSSAASLPRLEIIQNTEMLYVAIGILGATVMPHNLYLHSSIVQTRKYERTTAGKAEAIKFATIDSTVALMFALFINGAILVVSAATFHGTGPERRGDPGRLQAPLADARRAGREHALRAGAAGLGPELDADRHARRPDRHGRLSADSPAALAAPADHAADRHRAGRHRHGALRRARHGEPARLQPGHPEPAAAVRRRPARRLHEQPPQDGPVRQSALDSRCWPGSTAGIIIALNVKYLSDFLGITAWLMSLLPGNAMYKKILVALENGRADEALAAAHQSAGARCSAPSCCSSTSPTGGRRATTSSSSWPNRKR